MKIKIILALILIFSITSLSIAIENVKEEELLFMAKKAYEDGFYEVSLGMLERFRRDFPNAPKAFQATLLSGQCYFYQGRYLEALNVFEALANNPVTGSFRDAIDFWTAEVHFKGNNFAKAIQLYQKLISNFPQSSFIPAAYYSLGWSFFQLGKYNQAREIFTDLLEKFPREPQSQEAAFKLIECFYNLKEYAELKVKIKPVFKIFSNDVLRLPYLYFYLAESEYYLDNLEEAVKSYLKSAQTSQDPKVQVLARLGLGWSYLKLKKYKEAEEILMDIKLESLEPKSIEILLLGQAVLMSTTERFNQAKPLYEQLVLLSADPLIAFQGYLGQADAHFYLGEYPQAVRFYQAALSVIGQQGVQENLPGELIDKLYYNLGLAYLKQGQIDASADILKRITRKEGQIAQAGMLFQVGLAYEEAGELAKAEEVYNKIINSYPDFCNADYVYYQSALLQLKKQNYTAAVFNLNSMLDKFPRTKLLPEAVYTLGSAYFQQADYMRSYEAFNRFRSEFKVSPLYPQGLFMLARSMIKLGKVDAALDILKSILKFDSIDSELLQRVEYEIADGYFKLGQDQVAFDRFKVLRVKYPDSKIAADIIWWLGQYYYRNNDSNLARRYFNALIQDFPDSQLVADAFYALALTFRDENNLLLAADNFKMAIKLGNPDLKAQAAIALADIYIFQDKPEAALIEYRQLLQDIPRLNNLLLPRIAQAYYQSGNYAQAKLFYLKSIESADNYQLAELRFKLAEVYETVAENQAAIGEYLAVADLAAAPLELKVRALLRVAKLYEDKEDFKGALNIYQNILQLAPSLLDKSFVRERIEEIKMNTSVEVLP